MGIPRFSTQVYLNISFILFPNCLNWHKWVSYTLELVVVCDTPHVVGIGWYIFSIRLVDRTSISSGVVSESMKLGSRHRTTVRSMY